MYWVCNVSTCNRPRTALAFCSVNGWDAATGTRGPGSASRRPRPSGRDSRATP